MAENSKAKSSIITRMTLVPLGLVGVVVCSIVIMAAGGGWHLQGRFKDLDTTDKVIKAEAINLEEKLKTRIKHVESTMVEQTTILTKISMDVTKLVLIQELEKEKHE